VVFLTFKPKSQIPDQSTSDADTLISEEKTLVEPPIVVALLAFISVATNDSETSHEQNIEFDFTIDSNAEDENPIQTGPSLVSSLPFVLESVHDPLFVPQTSVATEINEVVEPSSSTQIIPQPLVNPNQFVAIETSRIDAPSSSTSITPQFTNVSPPPTLFLDYVILKEVCDNIFKDLNKLVNTISNFVHEKNYVDEWTSLREIVDYVMCELQKLSLEAHN